MESHVWNYLRYARNIMYGAILKLSNYGVKFLICFQSSRQRWNPILLSRNSGWALWGAQPLNQPCTQTISEQMYQNSHEWPAICRNCVQGGSALETSFVIKLECLKQIHFHKQAKVNGGRDAGKHYMSCLQEECARVVPINRLLQFEKTRSNNNFL